MAKERVKTVEGTAGMMPRGDQGEPNSTASAPRCLSEAQPQTLEKQLDVAPPHGRSPNQSPEPSWRLWTSPGVPALFSREPR